MGAYKSLVYKAILDKIKLKEAGRILGKLWQRGFYDIVIHNYDSFLHFVDYINDNPKNWTKDDFYAPNAL